MPSYVMKTYAVLKSEKSWKKEDLIFNSGKSYSWYLFLFKSVISWTLFWMTDIDLTYFKKMILFSNIGTCYKNICWCSSRLTVFILWLWIGGSIQVESKVLLFCTEYWHWIKILSFYSPVFYPPLVSCIILLLFFFILFYFFPASMQVLLFLICLDRSEEKDECWLVLNMK